jgi:hypothetical protein
MAFDNTLVRGLTYMNTGNVGFAPAFYTINYDGPSSDWVASADLDTYLRVKLVFALMMAYFLLAHLEM